jgi:hypothetical protein
MKIAQHVLRPEEDFPLPDFLPDLIVIFGETQILTKKEYYRFKELYPEVIVTGCSTSGSIFNGGITDEELVVEYIQFEKSKVQAFTGRLDDVGYDSYLLGVEIAKNLKSQELKHIFILSDGYLANGSELAKGLNNVANSFTISGGLAGDMDRFSKTLVINPETLKPEEQIVVGIGFYGDHIQVGFGSRGGWEPFGIERKVTKSHGNILYEIDDQPALKLYKQFLGHKSEELPASALLFPLYMQEPDSETSVVRTILSINDEDQSMTFAGNIPQGSTVRFMKSNTSKIIDGAFNAAQLAKNLNDQPELAILVSCVGRRLVLKQLADEEVEVVRDLFKSCSITGFYSYGELSPSGEMLTCELHNQTMTITTLKEI